MTKIKQMPHNLEAEKAVLGCILIDDEAAVECISELTEEHFYSDAHRTIFKAFQKLYALGIKIDLLTAADQLEKDNTLQSVGSMLYLSKLSDMPSAANYEFYIRLLENDYLSRQTIVVANEMLMNAYKGDGEGAIASAQVEIHRLANKGNTGNLEHIAQGAAEYMAELEDRQRGTIVSNGIVTGFRNLDEVIKGFKACELNIIAARPSIGKTAFALSIAANAAIIQKKRVAIFNLEMGRKEIIGRIMCNLSNIPFSLQQKQNGLKPSQQQEITSAYIDAVNSQIYIDDSADITPSKIMAKCRKLAAVGGLDLVIIDYLQLLSLGQKTESRQQEISSISRSLKIFAKEMKLPVIALSQLSRAGELRGGKPELSDLRESGSIEQDADKVMFLQRKKDEGAPNNVIDMYIEKNRNGVKGLVSFQFVGDAQRFLPLID